MKQLSTQQADFSSQLQQLLAWEEVSDQQVVAAVEAILAAVKQQGDAAVVSYTNQFDRVNVDDIRDLVVSAEAIQQAVARIDAAELSALEQAAARVRHYHEHQKQQSWSYTEADGTVLGQKVTALDKVGIYVPGGKASYPSSVLMNAIPAKVAGVERIVMVVPAPDGELRFTLNLLTCLSLYHFQLSPCPGFIKDIII